MKQTLREICARELGRLNTSSEAGSLSLDDVKKLEILTRSLKQLEDTPKETSSLDEITNEDLLFLAKFGADDGRHAEPGQEASGPTPRGAKKGRRRAVEERADTEDAP